MSKTVKLTDGVYIALDALRQHRETFSEAVERLIKLYVAVEEMSTTLGPSHPIKDVKRYQENVKAAADR